MAAIQDEKNCDVGMDGAELQAAVAKPGAAVRFEVVPCHPDEWTDIQMYVLQGLQPEASPDVFVEEGIKCKLRDTSTKRRYKILCEPFASVCTSRNVTVAMIGKKQAIVSADGVDSIDGVYQFVNKSVYPFAAEFDRTGQHCVKKCQTDSDCNLHPPHRPYSSPRGGWCSSISGKCERCPDKCGYENRLRYPPATISADECPSGLCCDFGMDGTEMGRNYDREYYVYGLNFAVLPCPSSKYVDINVYILKGLHPNASPQTFVSNGHRCTTRVYNGTKREEKMGGPTNEPFPFPPYPASFPPTPQYYIICNHQEYMRNCQSRKHTIAMIGTDGEGNFLFVNDTAYPLAGKFDSSHDGCSVNSALAAAVCVPIAVVLLLALFCRYKKKRRDTLS